MQRALPLVAFALGAATSSAAQTWQETCGRSPAGAVARAQAARDLGADASVLVVAAHPDDRYFLPAIWLRTTFGYRVSVLLATRGGGGQNSLGPETGDELERIRTLETEAGCSLAGASARYLNLPDGGYRRSASETFAEWGRQGTLRDLVRTIRTLRPDAVLTTHHAEEPHGHDQALVELLPEAVRLAADPSFAIGPDVPPHTVVAFYLGGDVAPRHRVLEVDAERLEPWRGSPLRRTAYEILAGTHVSPGPPAPIEAVFDPVLRLEPMPLAGEPIARDAILRLPSVFDASLWPWSRERAERLRASLEHELPQQALAPTAAPVAALADALIELRALRAALRSPQAIANGQPETEAPRLRDDTHRRDVADRLDRRIEALERLLLIGAGVQIEIDVPPGTVAVGGEQFFCKLRVATTQARDLSLRVEGLDGVEASLSAFESPTTAASAHNAIVSIRVPLQADIDRDPMRERFTSDRFVPPVRLRFHLPLSGIDVPVELTVPVELRAPVELNVIPRMLLLPSARDTVQFSVGVSRNTPQPVERELEVRAPAGYAIDDDRHDVSLRDQRAELFGFEVRAPDDRRPGVDVLRIRFGGTRVALPVHKIDVEVVPSLRIGVLRGGDDTLPSVLGIGGLGLDWSELSDADIAAADLRTFDTIVVDVRALRDRPAARRAFRRLLDFAGEPGRRLVLFYQKDTEFQPAGEAFLGAPFAPFHLGKQRVTRPDAPVRLLVPDHVLLRVPNVIRLADFDGWEQERALYLPRDYGAPYEQVLELGDPGQAPERGALLYARTGQGEYVYCALSLWRQLKKLHPGAVRLLVNLLTPARGR